MTDKTAHKLGILIVIGMLVQLAVIGYVFYSGYQRRVDTVKFQRLACERGKLDRKDNADFQVAHTVYITTVTGAKSVKEDVKRAARTAVVTFNRTSQSLAKRSTIDCTKVFPDATVFP